MGGRKYAGVSWLLGGALALAACGGGGAVGGGDSPVDAAAAPDLAHPAGEGVTLVMDPFVAPPGMDTYRCQNFHNPFGADVDVQGWESHMAAGSHHMLVFIEDNLGDSPAAPCAGTEFATMAYGAQTPDTAITYPDGVALHIPAGKGFRIASHYVNASNVPINATVKLTIYKAMDGTAKVAAGVFFYNNVGIFIPAGAMGQKVSKTCNVTHDMNVLYDTGHMHSFATNLTATLDGTTVYSSDQWEESPFQKYAPPQVWKAGQKIVFTCTYNNTSGGVLTFGESALKNEMCIFDGQYYPAAQTTIQCQ